MYYFIIFLEDEFYCRSHQSILFWAFYFHFLYDRSLKFRIVPQPLQDFRRGQMKKVS